MHRFFYLLVFTILFSCKKEAPVPTSIKQYTIEQFFQTEGVNGGSFNSDESKVLINSNRSKIFNVYELNLADTSMVAKTNSNVESYFEAGYVPGTDQYLYTADKGGNENDHIYLRKTDGSTQDLTPGAEEKASFIGWTRDKESFYYISNVRNPRFFDLYKMNKATWKTKLIYQNDLGMDVGSFSFNERYMVLIKNITTDKNEMYLYDGQTKSTKKISTDSLGDATYSPAAFELSDDFFYYLTNEGKDYTYIVKYKLEDGSKEIYYTTDWDVSYMSISENGKYHVIGINEDARDKVLVFDHTSGKELTMPPLPYGTVSGVTISPSEKNMLLTVVSDRSSSNKFLYNVEHNTLKQLTRTLTVDINRDGLKERIFFSYYLILSF